MRIAHATDIHWFVPPPAGRLMGKRLLGTANLYLRGRRTHFTRQVQDALVAHLVQLKPDAVVITGDLTAQALPEEFELARQQLAPVLDRFPCVLMAGNHDVYTTGSARDKRLEQHFSQWMHRADSPVGRMDLGHVTVLTLDPTRPHVTASGRVPDEQLRALESLLSTDELAGRTVIVGLHYPVLSPHGEVYDGRDHGLRNARDLIAVLERATVRPSAILHGHRHHGYQVDLELSDARIPIYNPGSGGYAYLPEQRRAGAMNVYNTEPGTALSVDRYMFDGTGFSPEPGGSYATGR